MDKDEAWERFYATGSVANYLQYVAAVRGEKGNENQHGRSDNKEGFGRGE